MSAAEQEEPRVLAPEWRQWLVENLLLGAQQEALVAVLVGAGVEAELARSVVRAETRDPYLQGSLRAVAMQRKLEGLLDMYGTLFRQAGAHQGVERHRALEAAHFHERYYFGNRPVVVQGALEAWGAPGRWSLEGLAERAGEVRVEAGPGVGSATLGEVAQGAVRGEGDAPCVARVPLLEREELRSLREALAPPRGYVAEPLSGSEPWLWLGPAGAELSLRLLRRNSLLCQVAGRSQLQLIPAFELHRVAAERGGRVPAAEPLEPPLRLEVALEPGELVLLPVGWWCQARCLEAALAVSFHAFATPEPNAPWPQPPPEGPEPTLPPRA